MRHGILKTKFGAGKDANDMLLRKMTYNFLTHGSLKTTETKAKVLKKHIDRLVEKFKTKTESNRNVLLKFVVHEDLIDRLYEQLPQVLGEVKGGYTKIQKLQIRYSDGAPMARLVWSKPVVIETKPVVKEAKPKKEEKPAVKEKKAKK